MKAREGIALALSTLLLLVSTAAADAARPDTSTASIHVDSWSYCHRLDSGQKVVRATNVTVDGLRKYSLFMTVDDVDHAPTVSGHKTKTAEWAPDSGAMAALASGSVSHRAWLTADTADWTNAASSGSPFLFDVDPTAAVPACAP